MAKKLTTTGYAILGFLGVGRFTGYELTEQVQRSLRYFWPRSGNVLYEIPKRLVADGLAAGSETMTGRRAATTYNITAAGRRAMRSWLGSPTEPPALHFEALVRVMFADQGTKDQLQATLAAVHADSLDLLSFGRTIGRQYREAGGPFPERLHVNGLIFDFMFRYAEAIRSWSEWAMDEVELWDSTGHQPDRHESLLARYAALTDAMEGLLDDQRRP